ALRAGAGAPVASAEDAAAVREFLGQVEHSRHRLVGALAELIEPDARLLRRSPIAVAHSLFMLLIMTSRATFGGGEPMDNAEVVSLLLDGLLVRPGGAPC